MDYLIFINKYYTLSGNKYKYNNDSGVPSNEIISQQQINDVIDPPETKNRFLKERIMFKNVATSKDDE